MILAKSCHDPDLIHCFANASPARLTSTIRPAHLCEENAPPDAPDYCISGCSHSSVCVYDAVAMYRDLTPLLLDLRKHTDAAKFDELTSEPPTARGGTSRSVSAVTDDLSADGIDQALRETRYRRCVYRVGDNDQPSSQSVSMLFSNGVNANFTMHLNSHREGRESRIDGE